MHFKFKYQLMSAALAAAFVLSGCASGTDTKTTESKIEIASQTEDITVGSESEPAEETTAKAVDDNPYEFNPHVYNAMLEASYDDGYRESFFNMCDALREGRDTFECSSKEAYDWCMNGLTLNQLFPAACMMISDKSNDGSAPFENGTGHIYYNIAPEEFVQMESDFEKEIVKIVNDNVKSSYTDFEKCLALYDYMVSNYKFDHNDDWYGNGYGANYFCLKEKKGICETLGGLYAYLLMQCGVDAIVVSNFGGGNAHAWTFVTIDGKNYHIDPTWALKDEYGTPDSFLLDYFMMTDQDRADAGYLADELAVPILPDRYAHESKTYSFVADDTSYRFPMNTSCVGYDLDKNTISYSLQGGNALEFEYG